MKKVLFSRRPTNVISAVVIVYSCYFSNLITICRCKSATNDLQLQHRDEAISQSYQQPSIGRLVAQANSGGDKIGSRSSIDQLENQNWIPIVKRAASLVPASKSQKQVPNDGYFKQLESSEKSKNLLNSTLQANQSTPMAGRDCGSKELASNKQVTRSKQDDYNENDDENNDDDEEEKANHLDSKKNSSDGQGQSLAKQRQQNDTDSLQGSDSVSLESSMAPPSSMMDYNDGSSQYAPNAEAMDSNQNNEDKHANGSPWDSASAASANQSDEDNYQESGGNENDSTDRQSQRASDEEAAVRREQEAAEASEAEAADRSALDEQRQAQREIILAQAQSEAKAIKEQQEALLRQQQLQQQILMRRHQSDLGHHDGLRTRASFHGSDNNNNNNNNKNDLSNGRAHEELQRARKLQLSSKSSMVNVNTAKRRKFYDDDGGDERKNYLPSKSGRQQQYPTASERSNKRLRDRSNWRGTMRRTQQPDKQFSDQSYNHGEAENQGYEQSSEASSFSNKAPGKTNTDNRRAADRELALLQDSLENHELGGDYSTRRTQHLPVAANSAAASAPAPIGVRPSSTATDLLGAAQQHHYGAHYSSLQGHLGREGDSLGYGGGHAHQHGGYYQFAESKKKGQFDSGFSRGGKKFHTSGHSSQHKSHAEGHVKWSGKKGEGTHYWDLKHKNTGHYGGGGGSYGGGQSYY